MGNSIESRDWQLVLRQALIATRLGRQVLLDYYGRLKNVEEKFQAGLVSEADRESEKVMKDYLHKNFPEYEFLGEESFAAGTGVQDLSKSTGGRWILDPLDGTTNYIHQFPIFCISLGLELNGQIQLAIIDVPVLGETYTAIRGQGAYVNGKKIHVSQTAEIKKSLLATGFFAENPEVLEEQIKIFSQIVKECRGIRRAGAAAYDLCMVARGVFDAYWEKDLKPWDTAAGFLIVEEAGGQVSTYHGQDFSPYAPSLIASNGRIHQTLVREIKSLCR